jgi:hypothetical protein
MEERRRGWTTSRQPLDAGPLSGGPDLLADRSVRGLLSYGRANPTALVVLFVCALSVSGAIFLILELDQPFAGLMSMPSEPLPNALAPLNP